VNNLEHRSTATQTLMSSRSRGTANPPEETTPETQTTANPHLARPSWAALLHALLEHRPRSITASSIEARPWPASEMQYNIQFPRAHVNSLHRRPWGRARRPGPLGSPSRDVGSGSALVRVFIQRAFPFLGVVPLGGDRGWGLPRSITLHLTLRLTQQLTLQLTLQEEGCLRHHR